MSKGKKAKLDTSYMKDYVNYLKNYDTSNVDNTLSNLTQYAEDYSKDLGQRMGDYTFGVDASDEARKRAEQATYQAYVDRLNPQFERQTDDMQTRLANQGLPVGSEAYQRALSDMLEKQNEAYNQAGYQSVLAGQGAYNQDIQNQISAGAFGNQAQQAYINQLLSALQGSASGYENQQNIMSARGALAKSKYENDKANAKNGLGGALAGAVSGGLNGFLDTGNPWGAVAGAGLGAYDGYNRNPYARG